MWNLQLKGFTVDKLLLVMIWNSWIGRDRQEDVCGDAKGGVSGGASLWNPELSKGPHCSVPGLRRQCWALDFTVTFELHWKGEEKILTRKLGPRGLRNA